MALHRELAAYAAAPAEPGLAAFRADLGRFTAAKRAEQMRLRAEGTRLRTRSIRIAAGGLILLLALIVAIAIGAVRAIVGPVDRLQRFARELGAGRFDARVPETGPPEFVELARAFNRSAETLQRDNDRHMAELDAVFRDSPLGLAFLDLDLRFLRVNEALARMNQVPAADHLGRRVGEVTGQHDIERALRRVVEAGEPLLDLDIALHGRRFEASYFAVRDDRGELLAVGKAMSDVTARREAEAARERLQAATAALARALTVADVARVAIEQGKAALGAELAMLLTLDAERERLKLVDGEGLPEAAGTRWSTVALSERMPATRAALSGTSVFLSDEAALLEQFPDLAGAPYPRAGSHAAVPLVAYGRTLGVLSFGFTRSVAFDRGERGLLHALAAQAAIALARAQLYEREHAVSQTLQASLLPRALPVVPGLDLAGRLEARRGGRRGRRRLLRRVRARRRCVGDRDRRRLRQGRRRRRADRARPAHDPRRRSRLPLAGAGAGGAQPRGARREPPGPVPDRGVRPPRAAAGRGLPAGAGLRRPSAAGGDRRRRPRARARVRGDLAGRDRGPTDPRAGDRRSSPATRCCSTRTG